MKNNTKLVTSARAVRAKDLHYKTKGGAKDEVERALSRLAVQYLLENEYRKLVFTEGITL